MATTPEQKAAIKQRNNLRFIHNGVISGFQFKTIKTWNDVYIKLGYKQEIIDRSFANKANDVLKEELHEFLNKQTQALEDKLNESTIKVRLPTDADTLSTKEQEVKEAAIKETTEHVEQLPSTSDTEQSTVAPRQDSQSKEVEHARGEQVRDSHPAVETEGLTSNNDYGFVASPNENFNPFWFQKKAIVELVNKILEGRTGLLLLAGTGTGKTYMVGGTARRLWDISYHEERTFSHIPYLYVTKSTVVEQASRVLKKTFNIEPVNDVEVVNIEQLRSKAGQFWIRREVKMVEGEEREFFIWKKKINPCVTFFDESQGGKNTGSTQSQIMCSYNNLLENACLVSISATPFTRISEAKCFAVSTHRPLDHLGFPVGTVLTNDNWPTYAKMIADPADPTEYNQAAIERLMKDLDAWIVRVKGVKPQFHAINGVKTIPFESEEKKVFYLQAWNRFLREKAKLDAAKAAGDSAGNFAFTILLKFSMAAEFCHAEGFADQMHRDVLSGKAAIAAVKFKATIIEIVRILNEKYGVSRDLISLIWGGGQSALTAKQKAKKKIKDLGEKLEAMGMSSEEMIEDMDLTDVEDREILNLPEHLRLGAQSMEERQVEIDKFQSGKSLYCCYTFRAGGVGLSLHHSDELTEFKCRRKPSGYVFEEDISQVPVRPRVTHVALTYNAIELVQGVGRAPRLTSLSNTEQYVYCYSGTVEVDIGRIVSQKLRCLSSVVKQKEDWQDVIMSANNESAKARTMQQLLDSTKDATLDKEDELLDEGGEEDDAENGDGKDK